MNITETRDAESVPSVTEEVGDGAWLVFSRVASSPNLGSTMGAPMSTEMGAGAEGCASGSQAWNGTIAAFSPNPITRCPPTASSFPPTPRL